VGFYAKPTGLLLFIVAVFIAHFSTPTTGHHDVFHVLYQRILYVPIVLAAFWYGWKGGLATALLIGMGYFYHIMHDWGGHFFTTNLNQTLEIVIYFVVGGLTGYLVDTLKRREESLSEANRKLSEQSRQLRQALDTLTEKTREVFDIEEQLRRSDRLAVLGQLSAGLAHEIRNPLGSIRGAAEILSDRDVSVEQRESFCRVLIEETERLDRVLGDFLSYTRSKRQQEEGPTTCDLKSALGKSLDLLSKEATARQIATTVSVPDEPVRIAIEETMLQQVFLNILLNSVQAMPNGGSIDIVAQADGGSGTAQIAISDTGPGIPAEHLEHIFDPFFTTKPQGSGLGLSIVEKILDNHHATIRADAAAHPGARFVMTLPLAPHAA
jgi:signal transduction histidine kinase